jgi:hypothetical protein
MKMEDIPEVGDRPAADTRVTELHAWICVHANGAEGVMATGYMLEGQEGHGVLAMEPLLRTVRADAERLGDQAHAMANQCGGRAEMRTFKVVTH